ncbi:pyridoxal phosphate-dependent aminotransferase [Dietzia sp.]|uniref:pyridoxal phosphate-dependent aminotransferase n=1 Tax=Dietzia sp. TaxID=1871616 RepID=UPI002FD95C2D
MMVDRLRPHAQTIFAEVSEAAVRHGAINLGQGFPDTDGPAGMLEVAAEAITGGGHNQYPPGRGTPELRAAVARQVLRDQGLSYDPDGEIIATVGATEGIAAALLGLVEPGEGVVLIEPYYDSYSAVVDLAGARKLTVPLVPADGGFALDRDALAAACARKGTSAVIVNSPHNPTGAVLSEGDLEAIAAQCREHGIVAISDEVYEHLVYDGREHRSIAELPGMRERTLRVSSAAKSFNCTGWKVGWVTGPASLVEGALAAKQYLSFSAGTPLQLAVAHALDHERAWISELRDSLAHRRGVLRGALEDAGFAVSRGEGTYFLLADPRGLGIEDGAELCRRMPAEIGVAAVPLTPFVDAASAPDWRHLVRFAFCKRVDVLAEAGELLRRLG